VVELSFRIFSNLINYRVQLAAHPIDGTMLNGKVRTLVGVIRMKENLPCFLEPDSPLRVPMKAFSFVAM